MNDQEVMAKYAKIAQEIAAELGGAITQMRPDMSPFMLSLPKIHPNAKLLLSFGGYRLAGRLVVRRIYPQELDGNAAMGPNYLTSDRRAIYGNPDSSISVSYERTPKAIARDITRRLLPLFGELLTELEAVRASMVDRKLKRAEIYNRVSAAAGSSDHLRSDAYALARNFEFYEYHGGHGSIKGRVSHDHSVDLELGGLTPEIACAVITLVRSANKPV